MTEKEIEQNLKGQMLDKKSLTKKLEAITAEQQRELDLELKHLIFAGIVGEHSGSYYLLADQKIYLAKVTMKTHNFVILKSIPDNVDIKISGRESDGLLIGDLLYVKAFQQGIYHALDYLKAITTLKGNYSLTSNGKEQLIISYLNSCGKSVLVSSKNDNLGINQGDLVEGEIQSFSGNTITVKITKLLVKASDVGSDISMIISSNDAPLTFPDSVMDEAKALPASVSEEEKKDRTDFRDHCVVTIDGDDAHDFDDAVEGKKFGNGYEVVVHIADVTHYMKPHHPLDDEAITRGTSIYVADRVVPMLPFELSNGICSLNPNEERLVLSVTMDVDTFGNVFNTKIEKGLIRSHGRLTYNKVNDFFDGKDCEYSQEIKDTLTVLHECSKGIRRRRELQGAMKLDSTELKFKLDENGTPTEVTKQVQGESEKMIEDLMIIANCSVAKALKHASIPVLYRVHEFPPLEKLANFKDFIKKMDPRLVYTFPKTKDLNGGRLNDFLESIKDDNLRKAISHMMLRALAKARYCPEELGHFGLAEMDYCHFTSPIRRYPDDIIHRLVKDYLIEGKSFDYDEVTARLETLGDITSGEEVKADIIERSVDDLESSKYMVNHIGELYHGTVTSMVQRGMFIETEIGIEGFLAYHCMHDDVFKFDDKTYSVTGKHNPDISFTIGTPIDVKVLASNPKEQEIDFATPEFYDRFALNLTEADREDLSLNGIQVEEEDEYEPMMGRARFTRSDDDRRDYSDSRYEDDYPEDESHEDDEYEDRREDEDHAEESGEDETMKKDKKVEEAEETKDATPVAEEKPAKKAKKATKKTTKKAVETAEVKEEPKAEATTDEVTAEVKPAKKAKKTTKKSAKKTEEEAAPVEEATEPIKAEAAEVSSDETEEKPAEKADEVVISEPESDDDGFEDEKDDEKKDDSARSGYGHSDFAPRRDDDRRSSYGRRDDRGYGDRDRRSYGDRGGRSSYGHSDDRGDFGHSDRGSYGHSDRGGFGHRDDDRRSFGNRDNYGHSRGGYGRRDDNGDTFDNRHSDRPSFDRDDRKSRPGFSDHKGYAGHSNDRDGGYGHSSDRGGYGHSDRGGYGHSDSRGYGSRDRGGYGHSSDRGGYGHSDRGGYGHSDSRGYGDRRSSGGYGHSDDRGYRGGSSDRGYGSDRGGSSYGHSDHGYRGGSSRGGFGGGDRGRGYGHSDRGGYRGGDRGGFRGGNNHGGFRGGNRSGSSHFGGHSDHGDKGSSED